MKALFACTFQGLVFTSYNFIRPICKCFGHQVPKQAHVVLDFLKGMREHSDFSILQPASISHLPLRMYADMFFTGHSQKTEVTRAPSPEHLGCGDEVVKAPSAYNQLFFWLYSRTKLHTAFFTNKNRKIYFRNQEY